LFSDPTPARSRRCAPRRADGDAFIVTQKVGRATQFADWDLLARTMASKGARDQLLILDMHVRVTIRRSSR